MRNLFKILTVLLATQSYAMDVELESQTSQPYDAIEEQIDLTALASYLRQNSQATMQMQMQTKLYKVGMKIACAGSIMIPIGWFLWGACRRYPHITCDTQSTNGMITFWTGAGLFCVGQVLQMQTASTQQQLPVTSTT